MRLIYDALATLDIAGGFLLLVLGMQTVYAALFRALHGDDERR